MSKLRVRAAFVEVVILLDMSAVLMEGVLWAKDESPFNTFILVLWDCVHVIFVLRCGRGIYTL